MSGAAPAAAWTPTAIPTPTPTSTPTPTPTAWRWAWAIPPAVLLVLWELSPRLGLVPAHVLPAPSSVAATLGALASGGELLRHLLATAGRVAVGFALGGAAGTLLGAATGHHPGTRRLLEPTLQALRAVPSLAWAPLFLLWLGLAESSKVALIALGAFFPVHLHLASGIRAIDPKLVEVGRLFGLRGAALVRRVLLPATLPAYLAGLRSGLALAWMFVVAAELMGASRGLGYLMVDGQTTSRPQLVVAAVVLFAVAGKASDALVVAAGRRFLGARDG